MKKAFSDGLFNARQLFLYFGYQEYQSIGSEVEEFFTGSPSSQHVDADGGAAARIVGLVGLFRK